MNVNKKHVWFNLNTGEFSNSWNQSDFTHLPSLFSEEELKEANVRGWKLIEYVCLNDEKFDFYNRMKVVTNSKKKEEKK